MKWYLFRHGYTFFSKTHIPYGPLFVHRASLLPEGRRHAKQMGQELKSKSIDALYSSPYKRCQQTAEIVGQIIQKSVIFDDRLGEQMITSRKETFAQMVARLKAFTDDVKKTNQSAVAVCSHGWPLGILIALLRKGSATKADLKNPPTGEIVEI